MAGYRFPEEFKQRLIAELRAGASPAELALKYDIKVTVLYTWKARYVTGNIIPGKNIDPAIRLEIIRRLQRGEVSGNLAQEYNVNRKFVYNLRWLINKGMLDVEKIEQEVHETSPITHVMKKVETNYPQNNDVNTQIQNLSDSFVKNIKQLLVKQIMLNLSRI